MTPLIHVTCALRVAGYVDAKWFTDYQRDRGTAVHLATQYLDQGRLDESTLDPAVRPRVESYKQFLADVRPKLHEIEMQCDDNLAGFTGTIDRLVHIDGFDGVLDLKGYPAPAHAVQLAAYRDLVRRTTGFVQLKRWALYLKDDGYRLERVETAISNDLTAFFNALGVARWRLEHGMIEIGDDGRVKP